MKLQDIAEILRFQDRREPAYEDEEEDRNGLVYGEAKPDDFDPVTGFLIPGGMSRVGLFRHPKKYALRKNDLLMFYNGAVDKIGLTGLVIDEVLAVPARILCIIRPYAVSGPGLFMYLRSQTIRKDILGLARPTSSETKAFLSLETLRGYEIDGLFVDAMKEAGDRARDLIASYRASRKEQEDMIYEIQRDLLNSWPD